MVKEKVNTTSKIIIPKKVKDTLSDDARKKLVEDLQNITPEEIEAIGNKIEEKLKEEELEEITDYDEI
ncbi:hypothetical protein IKI14_05240 [bacterium]|nr:hypothetical protein [bacterium]